MIQNTEVRANDTFKYCLIDRERDGAAVCILGYLSKSETAVIPAVIDDCPVTTIGEMAFKTCPIIGVEFPDSLIEIGLGAFQNCKKLTQVHLPAQVTVVRADAFSGCKNLHQIVLPRGLREIGTVDKTRKYDRYGGAFENCTSLSEISIPDSVVVIGRNTFKGCVRLKSIDIPRHIIRI